jgi:hypothetical protein
MSVTDDSAIAAGLDLQDPLVVSQQKVDTCQSLLLNTFRPIFYSVDVPLQIAVSRKICESLRESMPQFARAQRGTAAYLKLVRLVDLCMIYIEANDISDDTYVSRILTAIANVSNGIIELLAAQVVEDTINYRIISSQVITPVMNMINATP